MSRYGSSLWRERFGVKNLNHYCTNFCMQVMASIEQVIDTLSQCNPQQITIDTLSSYMPDGISLRNFPASLG